MISERFSRPPTTSLCLTSLLSARFIVLGTSISLSFKPHHCPVTHDLDGQYNPSHTVRQKHCSEPRKCFKTMGIFLSRTIHVVTAFSIFSQIHLYSFSKPIIVKKILFILLRDCSGYKQGNFCGLPLKFIKIQLLIKKITCGKVQYE